MGHTSNGNASADGVVNSPRFKGPMTRRAPSFKRDGSANTNSSTSGGGLLGTHYEIDLQINTPRSENGTVQSPRSHRHHHHGVRERWVVKSLLRKPVIGSAVVDLGLSGLRERKRLLGRWMFFLFCGFCLFLGVFKICAYGWFGSTIERAHSAQVRGTVFCSH